MTLTFGNGNANQGTGRRHALASSAKPSAADLQLRVSPAPATGMHRYLQCGWWMEGASFVWAFACEHGILVWRSVRRNFCMALITYLVSDIAVSVCTYTSACVCVRGSCTACVCWHEEKHCTYTHTHTHIHIRTLMHLYMHVQIKLSLASNDIMDLRNLTCLGALKALDVGYNLLDEVHPLSPKPQP